MNDQSYLIFELNHALYGISTSVVQELFFLPEITPIAKTSASIMGVINLRGDILPIVDLYQQLGSKTPPCQLTDSIIVLNWQDQRIGIIVTQILEVKEIAAEQIQSNALYIQSSTSVASPLIAGIARVDTTLVTILNPENLVFNCATLAISQTSALLPRMEAETTSQATDLEQPMMELPTIDLYSHLSPINRQILQQRSHNLIQAIDTHDSTGLVPLAVVGLEGEYFGLGLETIHEFTDIRKLSPLPCTPDHILGNMNLRGEIVTLVDISRVLNLASSSRKNRQKALVVRLDDLSVGIGVDDIFDVTYIDPSQISTAPVAIDASGIEYLQGVVPYRGKMMSIINLSRILTDDTLIVNEEV